MTTHLHATSKMTAPDITYILYNRHLWHRLSNQPNNNCASPNINTYDQFRECPNLVFRQYIQTAITNGQKWPVMHWSFREWHSSNDPREQSPVWSLWTHLGPYLPAKLRGSNIQVVWSSLKLRWSMIELGFSKIDINTQTSFLMNLRIRAPFYKMLIAIDTSGFLIACLKQSSQETPTNSSFDPRTSTKLPGSFKQMMLPKVRFQNIYLPMQN